MGEMISFASNGDQADGYLATPSNGSGPGVLVLQEWWGLAPQLKRVADRLAAEGFTALAPDLYHGELAGHDEMDKAAHLMSTMDQARAARDMGGAVDALLAHPAVTSSKVGVIGFCMGGMLSLLVAAQEGDKIGAATPFYGAPIGPDAPDLSGITAPVLGAFAANDDFFPPDACEALAQSLRDKGKDVHFEVYPGTGHAFANEDNPLGSYNADAATKAWNAAVEFLRKHLA
jgi:carboxymethylenebutenolidase